MERQTAAQEQILDQARIRYGIGAEFAYPDRNRRQVVMMTLDQAVQICGKHMANESANDLWQMLDKMHENAETLKDRGYAETARTLGEAAVKRHQDK